MGMRKLSNNCLFLSSVLSLVFLQSCGSDPNFSAVAKDATSDNSVGAPTAAGSNSVKIRFDSNSFMQIDDADLSTSGAICPGDAKKYYKPLALSSGAPSEMVDSANGFISDGSYGVRPAFIQNVSVDLTNANYYGIVASNATALHGPPVNAADPTGHALFESILSQLKVSFDKCSYRYNSRLKSSYCAAFDSPISQLAGIPSPDPNTENLIMGVTYSAPSAFLIPFVSTVASGGALTDSQFRYVPPRTTPTSNSFYKMLDVKTVDDSGTEYYSCADQGIIQSEFPEETRLNVGGVDIDIDRSQLAPRENLLMHLTYIPMGRNTDADGPDYNNGANKPVYDEHSEAVFKVHLMSLGDNSPAVTRAIAQPRHLNYTNEITYPKTVATLAVLTRPLGQVRDEQLVIPLSMSSSINRIRIERVQGSAVLLEVSIYRLGAKL